MYSPYFKAANEVHESGLTAYGIAVILYLLRCSNNGQMAFPSYDTIAEKAGMGRTKAVAVIADLVKKDLAAKEGAKTIKGGRASNRYKVFLDISEYFKVPNSVFEKGLTCYEIAVFSFILRCTNNRKTGFPSYDLIAEKAGMSRRKAVEVVKKLESAGLILKQSFKKNSGKQAVNCYSIPIAKNLNRKAALIYQFFDMLYFQKTGKKHVELYNDDTIDKLNGFAEGLPIFEDEDLNDWLEVLEFRERVELIKKFFNSKFSNPQIFLFLTEGVLRNYMLRDM